MGDAKMDQLLVTAVQLLLVILHIGELPKLW